jgi:hypothetical protein
LLSTTEYVRWVVATFTLIVQITLIRCSMITTSGIDPTIRLRLQKLYSCKSERGTVVLQIMRAIDDLCDINEIERD